MLHLWGRLSSINVRKVVLCAQVLGIELPRTDAGLAFGVVDTPDYRSNNPNGLVPLLRDGDFTLWESNAIVRYLCAREGKLYPSDLQQRFNAERWMDWQQTTLNPAGSPGFKQWVRTAPEQRNPQVIAQSVAATEPLFALLDEHLSHQAFMGGDALTMADIPIACEVHRWWGLPQPRPAWPHLERWYAGWLAMPASRGVLDLPLS
ncbi:glutathione S-transferase [Hydrogenophaga sp.]|uniref:glutathione S-transferase n=1 Tax=Hydrogenophaga sp. TaxID=1904254 RepID=UPI002730DEF8|nr:glutathione S-transferase [Hydrogenophaga sp.]MDP2016134.1 glutathione S-transferase [Hydrogenophaga sp.]MDP3164825.1 glutathione S-transferase [Hydrogenophaga sp.]MDP3813359.1 glutathione S-transferase [Hydrogenophaga sp.]